MSSSLNCHDANTHLLQILKDQCNSRMQSLSISVLLQLIRQELLRFPEALIGIVAAVIYVAAACLHSTVSNSDGRMYMATAILLALMFLIQLGLSVWRARLESIERVGVLRQRVIFFIKNRFQYQSASSLRFRVPPLDKLVLVLRDRMWMRLPVQVLVSGDVIQLFAGEPAPCRVRPIVRRADSDLFEDLDGELCIGEEWDRQLTSFTLSPLVQNEAFVELSPLKPAVSLQNKPTQAFFRVIEEPSLTLIDTVFGDALQRPQTMFANYARILRRTNFYLLLVGVVASMLLRFFSLYLPSYASNCSSLPSPWLYSHSLIAFAGELLLPISFVSLPALLFVLDAAAHAYLFAAHEETQRQISALRPKLSQVRRDEDDDVVPPQLIPRSVRSALRTHFVTSDNNNELDRSQVDSSDSSSDSCDSHSSGQSDHDTEQEGGGKSEAVDEQLLDFADSPSMMLTAAIQPSNEQVWDQLVSILRCESEYLVFSTNPIHSLGTVNYVCMVDKPGLLSTAESIPEHLLLPNEVRDDIIDVTPVMFAETETVNSMASINAAEEQLDKEDVDQHDEPQQPDSKAASFMLDGDWKSHLSALKPMGLNAILNSRCFFSSLPQPGSFWPLESEHLHSLCHEYDSAQSASARDPFRFSCLSQSPGLLARRLSYLTASHRFPGECFCALGTQIGFDAESVIGRLQYRPIKRLHLSYPMESNPSGFGSVGPESMHLSSVLVECHAAKRGAAAMQLFSHGTERYVLAHCSEYFDGRRNTISTLNSDCRRRFLDIASRWRREDMDCIAFSYTPVLPKLQKLLLSVPGDLVVSVDANSKDAPVVNSAELTPTLRSEWLTGQIWLGMAAFRTPPKTEMTSFVEDSFHAGMRYAMFLPDSADRIKAFAFKIGLETDWNCCISLADPDERHAPLSPFENISKLPQGVSSIRQHLRDIDDVPLLVSLFADSSPETSEEMVRIIQENGGVVLAVGSPLHGQHTRLFSQADVSVCLDPLSARQCNIRHLRGAEIPSEGELVGQSEQRKALPAAPPAYPGQLPTFENEIMLDSTSLPPFSFCFEYSLASALGSLPAALSLNAQTNLHQVTALVGHSRRLYLNYKQGVSLLMALQHGLFAAIVLTAIIDAPKLLQSYQIVWLTMFLMPLLCASLLFSPSVGNLMKMMPDKNEEHLADIHRFVVYWSARVLPTFIAYVLWFIWCLSSLHQTSPISQTFFWSYLQPAALNSCDAGRDNRLLQDSDFRYALLSAQNYSMVFLVWSMIAISSGFMHRTQSIVVAPPWRNRVWIAISLIVLVLQLAFCSVSIAAFPDPISATVTWPSSGMIVAAVLWPLLVLAADEVVKRHDATRYAYYQRKLRLTFETKLGMYSPK